MILECNWKTALFINIYKKNIFCFPVSYFKSCLPKWKMWKYFFYDDQGLWRKFPSGKSTGSPNPSLPPSLSIIIIFVFRMDLKSQRNFLGFFFLSPSFISIFQCLHIVLLLFFSKIKILLKCFIHLTIPQKKEMLRKWFLR